MIETKSVKEREKGERDRGREREREKGKSKRKREEIERNKERENRQESEKEKRQRVRPSERSSLIRAHVNRGDSEVHAAQVVPPVVLGRAGEHQALRPAPG